jgi:hypothetical protein
MVLSSDFIASSLDTSLSKSTFKLSYSGYSRFAIWASRIIYLTYFNSYKNNKSCHIVHTKPKINVIDAIAIIPVPYNNLV